MCAGQRKEAALLASLVCELLVHKDSVRTHLLLRAWNSASTQSMFVDECLIDCLTDVYLCRSLDLGMIRRIWE